jgi:DNA adenine methylase
MREPAGADEDPAAADRVPARPFLKWAGGKWAVAPRIEQLLPPDARERVYREPFLGSGAMFFHLQPQRASLTTPIGDVAAVYQVVQHSVDALITRLEKLRESHSSEQFYAVRATFNRERDAPRIERAAWLVYLNKTCYNGLFRTNRSGEFNVPLGRYAATPAVVDPPALRLAAAALASAEIRHAPFDHLLTAAEPGDLVYFDPPYVPVRRSTLGGRRARSGVRREAHRTSRLSSSADGGFTLEDQARLADVYRALDARGCLLALSNSDTPEVRRLYAGYDVSPVIAPRAIGARSETRGEVTELLIRNLARYPRRGRLC